MPKSKWKNNRIARSPRHVIDECVARCLQMMLKIPFRVDLAVTSTEVWCQDLYVVVAAVVVVVVAVFCGGGGSGVSECDAHSHACTHTHALTRAPAATARRVCLFGADPGERCRRRA